MKDLRESQGIFTGALIGLVFWVMVVCLSVYGCAGVGQFTPEGQMAATNAVNVATGLLHSLDAFYGDLLALKIIPDHQTQATRGLAIADEAAKILKVVIAGGTVTNEQLNVAAGQVDGAKAILQEIK